MSKIIKSRYITDVEITKDYVELSDSTRCSYYIDVKNEELMNQFKEWYRTVFSKGIHQFLTVFEVSKHLVDNETHLVIEKFINFTVNKG